MNTSTPHKAIMVDRRRFFKEAAGSACGAGMAGLGLSLMVNQARAKPAIAIRPPGALAEDEFLASCVHCGQCVVDCPYETLRLSHFGSPVASGTPYFIARDVPCEMCDDIPCVEACPTGALSKDLTVIEEAEMGVAVLVSQDACLNYLGLRCDVCYRVCPVIDKAIRLDRQHNERSGAHAMFVPVVDPEYCTGCGKCERSCVLPEAAIKVLPHQLALGELGEHYRLGWEEKERRGKPLVEDVIDLPDRLPDEAMKERTP